MKAVKVLAAVSAGLLAVGLCVTAALGASFLIGALKLWH